MRFFLCRHGQDEDNLEGLLNGHRNRALTALGRQQATIIADAIAAQHSGVITHVMASPLQRANDTAEAIAAKLNLTVMTNPNLIERDFGILTGKPIAEIKKYATDTYQGDNVLYFLNAPEAESFEACFQRAKLLLEDLASKYAQTEDQQKEVGILLVCHGDIGKMLMAARKGIPWKEALDAPYIANTGFMEL